MNIIVGQFSEPESDEYKKFKEVKRILKIPANIDCDKILSTNTKFLKKMWYPAKDIHGSASSRDTSKRSKKDKKS